MLNVDRQLNLLARAAAIVTLTVSLVATAAGAANSPNGKNKLLSAFASPTQIMVEHTVDGSSFLQDMTDAVNSLKAYSFIYDTTVFKGGKTISQVGKFYFKQPRLMRVEMTGSYKHGAVACLGADGKIRGHLGGALSAFTVTVSANSDLLLGANGYPMLDSDFGGMVKVMRGFVQQGCKVKVTDSTVAVEGQPGKVYVLEFYKGGDIYKRGYIDPKTLLPVEWFDYQDGQLFAHTVWKNVRFDDSTIADSLFQI